MTRLFASLSLTLALVCGRAEAVTVTSLGVLNTGSGTAVASAILPLTSAAPAGQPIAVYASLQSNLPTGMAFTDSAATPNTYTVLTAPAAILSNSQKIAIGYVLNPTALPAPCTLTASYNTTTLTVSAVGTCPATDTLTAGMAATGGTLTAGTLIGSGGCTLSGGAGSCPITGNAATAGPSTITVSSTIKMTWTSGSSFEALITAATVSGCGTASIDTVGTAATGATTTVSINTNTLGTPVCVAFGVAAQLATGGGNTFTQSGVFTNLVSSNATGANRVNAYLSYYVPPGVGPYADAGSLNVTTSWWGNTFAFKGSGAGPVAASTLTILGVH